MTNKQEQALQKHLDRQENTLQQINHALGPLLEFVRLAATGPRADGTYNYCREALEQKAKQILQDMKPKLPRTRQQLADFLDRLATNTSLPDDWEEFAIQHYHDNFMEDMRRCAVRLATGYIKHDNPAQLYQAWAIALRSSVPE